MPSQFNLGLITSRLLHWLTTAARWWQAEFLNLFPPRVASWLAGDVRHRLILETGEEIITAELRKAGRAAVSFEIPRTTYTAQSLDNFLREHGLTRATVSLGLRVPDENVFTRRLRLPREVSKRLAAVLDQDLALKTPFDRAQIEADFVFLREGPHLKVWQWLIPRPFIREQAEALGEELENVAFIEGQPHGKEPVCHVSLNDRRPSNSRTTRVITLGLTACVTALVVGSSVARYNQQQVLLDRLSVEVPAAMAKASAVRAMFGKLDAEQKTLADLRQTKREGPGFLEVWEEVSRRLPSDTWLTELRLVEKADGAGLHALLTGFSGSAAQLVPLLDQSRFFGSTSLTAAIAYDAQEARERFTLQTFVAQVPHSSGAKP